MFVHLKNNIEVSLSEKDDSIAISLWTLVMLPPRCLFRQLFSDYPFTYLLVYRGPYIAIYPYANL